MPAEASGRTVGKMEGGTQMERGGRNRRREGIFRRERRKLSLGKKYCIFG